MTVGFHTVDHGMLPDMDDAVARRRPCHAAATSSLSAPVLRCGTSPTPTARRTSARPPPSALRDSTPPLRAVPSRSANATTDYRLGRWEPGPIGVDDLLVKLAVRLHRAAPEHRLS